MMKGTTRTKRRRHNKAPPVHAGGFFSFRFQSGGYGSHKHADGDAMKKLMTLSLAVVFALSTSMACAQSKRGQKWLGPNERWVGTDQAIRRAGANARPRRGNKSGTT